MEQPQASDSSEPDQRESPPDVKKMGLSFVYKRFGVLGLVAVIALFWFARDIRPSTFARLPLIREVVSWWNTESLPQVDPGTFTVAIAKIELDERDQFQRLISEAVAEFGGVETLPIDRVIRYSGGTLEDSVDAGNDTAQEYLRRTGADILVWGVLLRADGGPDPILKLHVTPSVDVEGITDAKYAFTDEYGLPELFYQDLVRVLGLVVASYGQDITRYGQFPAEGLDTFVESVRKLIRDGREYIDRDRANHLKVILAGALRTDSREPRTDRLEEAAQLYQQVLGDLDTHDPYHEVKLGYTQNGLGLALMNLGKNDADTTRLSAALHAFDRALEVTSHANLGVEWAVVQLNRGLTLRGLGERDQDASRLEGSVEVIRSSVSAFSGDSLRRAHAQAALGTTLQIAYERRPDVMGLPVSCTLSQRVSRTFRLAIILVHHTRKNSSDKPGLALRGSSDFHAWGDSNLYLRARRGDLILTSEHRFAAPTPPLGLTLVTEQTPVRLEVIQNAPDDISSLGERILVSLGARPRRQDELRRELSIRNQKLTDVLRDLQSAGWIDKTPDGWQLLQRP